MRNSQYALLLFSDRCSPLRASRKRLCPCAIFTAERIVFDQLDQLYKILSFVRKDNCCSSSAGVSSQSAADVQHLAVSNVYMSLASPDIRCLT